MKKLIIILTALICINFGQNQKIGNINLEITGLGSEEGMVMIALFDCYDDYTNSGSAYKTAEVKIVDKKAIYSFKDLPFGEYAIRLFHDENSNQKFDTGLFGIPTEDYAFSNNAKGNMGPASYEDAKFKLDKNVVQQKLVIQ